MIVAANSSSMIVGGAVTSISLSMAVRLWVAVDAASIDAFAIGHGAVSVMRVDAGETVLFFFLAR